MKRYTEYTTEELASLDDGTSEKLIAIECAVAGLPTIEPELPECPVFVLRAHARTVVVIENLCVSENVAKCIRGLIEQFPCEVFSNYDSRDVVKPGEWNYPKFNLIGVETPIERAETAERRVAFDLAWGACKKAEAEQVALIERRTEVAKAVHEAREAACGEMYQQRVRRAEWDNLFAMCNGDTLVAGRFYEKRFGEAVPSAWLLEA